jgi:hypothetical protein
VTGWPMIAAAAIKKFFFKFQRTAPCSLSLK